MDVHATQMRRDNVGSSMHGVDQDGFAMQGDSDGVLQLPVQGASLHSWTDVLISSFKRRHQSTAPGCTSRDPGASNSNLPVVANGPKK